MASKMMRPGEQRFVAEARVAHLATVSRSGVPQVVPICFALVGDTVYSALDHKPKTVNPVSLRRVRNILANSRVALVVDEYDEDWQKLAFVLLRGNADLISPGEAPHDEGLRALREKYPQYREAVLDDRPIVRIVVRSIRSWSTRPTRFGELRNDRQD